MDQNLLLQISQAAARCLNENRTGELKSELNNLFPPGTSGHDKFAALAVAPIYALSAEQPGYTTDGQPGYLPADADLKAAVLNEIRAMIEADFDVEEHKCIWQGIESSVAATPEQEFEPGVAVNCPDDYLLTLDKLFVSQVLRQYNAMPDWH